MNTKEILIAAKALIDTPEKWTQGAVARTVDGFKTYSSSSDAVCFCSLGAILKAVDNHNIFAINTIQVLENEVNGTLGEFNDSHTHSEMMKAFDKAIAGCDA